LGNQEEESEENFEREFRPALDFFVRVDAREKIGRTIQSGSALESSQAHPRNRVRI
jgi:hypothetical protein